MKITFLGTGHGIPEETRFCQSILIEVGESAYLFDGGAPVVHWMIRNHFDMTRIKTVFTTHLHGDHVNGLLELADLCMWAYQDTDCSIYLTEQSGVDAFRALLNATYGRPMAEDRIRFCLLDGEKVYGDDTIRITPMPTDHLAPQNRPAYGFKIEAEGKTIHISGDMSESLADYPAYVNEETVDAFVVECAHFMPDCLVEKLKGCQAKQVMLIHGYRPAIAEEIQNFKSIAPFPLLCPNDNDSFIL